MFSMLKRRVQDARESENMFYMLKRRVQDARESENMFSMLKRRVQDARESENMFYMLKRRVQDVRHSWAGPSVDVRGGCRSLTYWYSTLYSVNKAIIDDRPRLL